jgi:hypothetical protein
VITDDKIALQELQEKCSDASLLREMIGFAVQRLMALETEICFAAQASTISSAERQKKRMRSTRRPSRSGPGQLVEQVSQGAEIDATPKP